MPYTSPRPRLRPLNLARLEFETETVLHKVFMPVTSSMVKVDIRDRVRDRELENGLCESETETLESRDTRDETRGLCLGQSHIQRMYLEKTSSHQVYIVGSRRLAFLA